MKFRYLLQGNNNFDVFLLNVLHRFYITKIVDIFERSTKQLSSIYIVSHSK